jgi:hypothetical protein
MIPLAAEVRRHQEWIIERSPAQRAAALQEASRDVIANPTLSAIALRLPNRAMLRRVPRPVRTLARRASVDIHALLARVKSGRWPYVSYERESVFERVEPFISICIVLYGRRRCARPTYACSEVSLKPRAAEPRVDAT